MKVLGSKRLLDKVPSGLLTEQFTRYSSYSERGTKKVQRHLAPLNAMTTLTKAAVQDSFSELEAVRALGITLARLHELLDCYVFNEGTARPPDIRFGSSDLLLLAYWNKDCPSPEPIPPRKNVVSITSRR
jgi:hypothetical protein